MRHRNQRKRSYQVPQSTLSEVLFETDLLGQSVRMFLYVDELENINATAGDDANSDMYFEF